MRLLLSIIFSFAVGCGKDATSKPTVGEDGGGDMSASDVGVADSATADDGRPDLAADLGIDLSQDASTDLGGRDMAEEPALRDGWFATQTVAQRPYEGQNTTGRWHSTTLAVSFFPQPASADEICGAMLTGYAFVIESAGQRWPVTGMDVEVVDNGAVLLPQREFNETSPGVWIVEFEDTPIPIEDTEIGERVLNVNIDRAADYGETSVVTLVVKLQDIEGCDPGVEPRLRAMETPAWNGPLLADALLARPGLLTPADVEPGSNSIGLIGLTPPIIGWYATGTSENPRCTDVNAVVATLERRGGEWEPSTMSVDVELADGTIDRTVDFVESGDEWRAAFTPPIAVDTTTDIDLRLHAEEGGERDRFMFRHFWLETGPVAPCP